MPLAEAVGTGTLGFWSPCSKSMGANAEKNSSFCCCLVCLPEHMYESDDLAAWSTLDSICYFFVVPICCAFICVSTGPGMKRMRMVSPWSKRWKGCFVSKMGASVIQEESDAAPT